MLFNLNDVQIGSVELNVVDDSGKMIVTEQIDINNYIQFVRLY